MHIRTFRAANLQSALEEIRSQMGPEATVLHTRQVRDGWMGWLGRTRVEVTAGLNPTTVARPSELRVDRQDDPAPRDTRMVGGPSISPAVTVDPTVAFRAGQGGQANLMPSHANRIALSDQPVPGEIDQWQTTESFASDLMAAGVRGDVVRRWLTTASRFAAEQTDAAGDAVSDRIRWWEFLQRAVAQELNLCGPIRIQMGAKHVVALVGPTGVGKTTTVAKLAAGFRIEAKRRVGLVTIDTYRIAAVQQLKAYAEIMDLPMQVVESPDQMQTAIEALGDVDLVLIDTAGRSPRSGARVNQLVEFLSAARPDETHLVLSATSSADSIESTLEGFQPVAATSVILTKLDEASSTAAVLSSLTKSENYLSTPLSYVTNGQQVPDDIAVADSHQLVQHLLPRMPVGMAFSQPHGATTSRYEDAA